MEALIKHEGIIAPLDRANVDTDQIIPKQFLKSILRTGFGGQLFFDWRYLPDGKPDPSFELNRPEFKNASVLVTQNNFGCGSSREHAVWAIAQYGFVVIIAPSKGEGEARIPAFADIFRNNCGKNALITIELSQKEVDEIFAAVNQKPGTRAVVDLATKRLTVKGAQEKNYSFDMDPAVRERIMKGLDDIGITLGYDAAIAKFEKQHPTYLHG